MSFYSAPEGFRDFPRARVVSNVDGWRVGSIGYYDANNCVIWNEVGNDYAYHSVDGGCELTDEPCNLGDETHRQHSA